MFGFLSINFLLFLHIILGWRPSILVGTDSLRNGEALA